MNLILIHPATPFLVIEVRLTGPRNKARHTGPHHSVEPDARRACGKPPLSPFPPSWAAARSIAADLPLYSACAAAIIDTFKACGVDPEMGTALHRVFTDAGLPPPTMSMEILLGADAEFSRAPCDILQSLEPEARRNHVSL